MRVLITARQTTNMLSAPRYAASLRDALTDLGCTVMMLSPGKGDGERRSWVLRVPPLLPRKALSSLAYTVAGGISRMSFQVDVVHGMGYTVRDDVTTVHFLRKAFTRNTARLSFMKYSQREVYLEHLLLRSSRHLVAPSAMVKEDLVRLYGYRAEKISVVPNGVDKTHHHPPTRQEAEDARKMFGIEGGWFAVGFAGPAWKGLSYLIRAVALAPSNVHILAVNIHPEEQGAYLDLARSSGVAARVRLLPMLNGLSTFYNALDAFVLPSVYDTFSMSSLEAMAHGIPVIVSSAAGIADIITDGEDGLILEQFSDVAKIADGIRSLASDEAEMRRIGSNATRTAGEFSWNRAARSFLGLYEGLSARH